MQSNNRSIQKTTKTRHNAPTDCKDIKPKQKQAYNRQLIRDNKRSF
jgi:hypothetical protein